jgi:hypothetical protein
MSTDEVAPAEAVRNDTLRDLTSDRLRDTESGDDACCRPYGRASQSASTAISHRLK